MKNKIAKTVTDEMALILSNDKKCNYLLLQFIQYNGGDVVEAHIKMVHQWL